MVNNDIKNLASALIIMGALVSCGEDIQDVDYNIDDQTIHITSSQLRPKLAMREQCYGIALAQYNDCATGSGTNCAGTASLDYQSDRWKYVERGSCGDQGGSLSAKKDLRLKY